MPPLAVSVGDTYEVSVSYEGEPGVIRMGSDKYADVSPVIRYLNPLSDLLFVLARREADDTEPKSRT